MSAFNVADAADHVAVTGVSSDEVREALSLLERVRVLQADQVGTTREGLVHALMTQGVSLTPPATVSQARRLAAHRDALMATPIFTYASLRELRGDAKESSTRTWFARRRAQHALFSLTHDGRTLIPAFQFDDNGQPRPDLQPLLAPLQDAGVDGWTMWTWLTSSTSLLAGEIPEQVARTAPQRAVRSARRFASRPAT